jgi:hypothetical protein
MAQRQTKKQRCGDWIVAIPSYKRAETLRDKTLVLLKSYKVPASRIHVFVANNDELAIYKSTLDPTTYGHIHVGVPGMAAIRNFITEFFPKGKAILNMDDDIKGFMEYDEERGKPLTNFCTKINNAFALAKKTGFRLFGFYPVANAFFMKDAPPTQDLRYVIGSVWGIINPGTILTVTIDDKEDYLRSVIMYLLDGGILRYTTIAPISAYYKEPGGMQETRTMKRIEASANAMVSAFPDLVTINLTKKSGIPEVRLRDKRPEHERVFGEEALKKYTMPRL